VRLLRNLLERTKEMGSAAAPENDPVKEGHPELAHLIASAQLFTRSWAFVEFAHRAQFGTCKVGGSISCPSLSRFLLTPRTHALLHTGAPQRTRRSADSFFPDPVQDDAP